MMRSLLFVPADSERKLAKALAAGADALVLDLEDAVLPERKSVARVMMRSWLEAQPDRTKLWVRVNDLASGELLKDLAHALPARPAGIMLPKIGGPEDVATVGHYLDALEEVHGLPKGHIRIIALVTETPLGLLRLGELARQRHPRISHVSWGAEDLSSALGAGDPRTSDGAWRPTYVHARLQCLLTAHAMGVEAIDTIQVNFKDSEGLRATTRAARYDGFTGRLAIHPDQVPVINEAFTPTDAERAHAQRVVDAFSAGAGAGTLSLDGKMLDIPHLRAARRVLGIKEPA
jgi:citrate lyase subunit beta / citryl-CoA lyase